MAQSLRSGFDPICAALILLDEAVLSLSGNLAGFPLSVWAEGLPLQIVPELSNGSGRSSTSTFSPDASSKGPSNLIGSVEMPKSRPGNTPFFPVGLPISMTPEWYTLDEDSWHNPGLSFSSSAGSAGSTGSMGFEQSLSKRQHLFTKSLFMNPTHSILDEDTTSDRVTSCTSPDLDDMRQFYLSEEATKEQNEDELAHRDLDPIYQAMAAALTWGDLSPPDASLTSIMTDATIPASHFGPNWLSGNEDLTEGTPIGGGPPVPPQHLSTCEQNLTIDQFIRQWLMDPAVSAIENGLDSPISRSTLEACNLDCWPRPARVVRPSNHPHDFYDIQQIPWREKLQVDRSDARALRDCWYTPYHNVDDSRHRFENALPPDESCFREKAMYTQCRARIEHFQLRNLMSVTSHNTVRFCYDSKLYSWVPAYDDLTCLIDLSQPSAEAGLLGAVRISTMKSKFGVSIVGGYRGEYGLHADGTQGAAIQGLVTRDNSGITNHIEVIQHRTNRSPVAVFASNDKHLRLLDCETNKFVGCQALLSEVNCSDTSSDGRLRVVIGDSPDTWIVEAETGRLVQTLRGHRDYGFACAWSPDMRQVATSNQDKTVQIWDARNWQVLQTIDSDVAGYRSLRFSPIGGGPRTLLMCEPADRITIVNAQTYQSRQVHDFFGEIAGADYTPDGSSIWVANADDIFGGFIEYERRQWGQQFGLSFSRTRHVDADPDLPEDWVSEARLDEDERCMLSAWERRSRFMQCFSDEDYDKLLL